MSSRVSISSGNTKTKTAVRPTVNKTASAAAPKKTTQKPSAKKREPRPGNVPLTTGGTLFRQSGAMDGVRGDSTKALNEFIEKAIVSLSTAAHNASVIERMGTVKVRHVQCAVATIGIPYSIESVQKDEGDDEDEE